MEESHVERTTLDLFALCVGMFATYCGLSGILHAASLEMLLALMGAFLRT